MDVTVNEELQTHTPLKTQRKTSAQDEILQAAAADVLGEKNGGKKETMAMSSTGVTRCISVTDEKDWVTKKKSTLSVNFREPQQRPWWWIYLFIFFFGLKWRPTNPTQPSLCCSLIWLKNIFNSVLH